jgi:hypothetical protein
MFGRGGGKPTRSHMGGEPMDGYSTEEDNKEFESDRRFSNTLMFVGAFSMILVFLASNVVHLKKQREREAKKLEP